MNAYVTIEGTGLVGEPIAEIVGYSASKVAAARGWGPVVEVVFCDGSMLSVFADEIFIGPGSLGQAQHESHDLSAYGG